jgi:hypothetical protein
MSQSKLQIGRLLVAQFGEIDVEDEFALNWLFEGDTKRLPQDAVCKDNPFATLIGGVVDEPA